MVFLMLFGVAGSVGTYYYTSHLQETPVTGRKRFIMVTREQAVKIADYEAEVVCFCLFYMSDSRKYKFMSIYCLNMF